MNEVTPHIHERHAFDAIIDRKCSWTKVTLLSKLKWKYDGECDMI